MSIQQSYIHSLGTKQRQRGTLI